MNPEEIRAIAYAVVAAVLVTVGGWVGFKYEQAQWNIDKVAQSSALTAQQSKIIELQQQRDTLQNQVEISHAQIIANGAALVSGVTTSLRAVESAVRSRPVSTPVVNTGAVQNALASAGINQGIADAIGRVDASIEKLATACVNVDADRTAIIGLEPKPASVH